MSILTERVHARVGLLGNPSDGYHGCCISFCLANFWAEVQLQSPSPMLQFVPHPVHDSAEYQSLEHFADKVNKCGYYGGVRLMQVRARTGQELHSRMALLGNADHRLWFAEQAVITCACCRYKLRCCDQKTTSQQCCRSLRPGHGQSVLCVEQGQGADAAVPPKLCAVL